MKHYLLLIFAIFNIGQFTSFAQEKPVVISGIVQDANGEPIDYATVSLLDTHHSVDSGESDHVIPVESDHLKSSQKHVLYFS
ncbi:carboxypeptidase-like regulatory domain-containing protein [Myroides odoratimimus]|uniref:carboxypeptidase-like regulatory domain-containing protein n=1 Tax=Myroides odoratimimus TaxID=76832 RepID=UPI0026DF33F8|nr:carboxypeptidase-like regulatory domain-containing protein [Myroides odoratimimus]MDO5858888.1 carboxypeptidase-like regulatory domain-containing protein [Myroides odoratimimus]